MWNSWVDVDIIQSLKKLAPMISREVKSLIMQNVQYITDFEGHKTAVILPIEDYEEMLEDLHFGEVARESKDEPKRDFNAKIPQFCLK